MTREQHAAILGAYMGRIPLKYQRAMLEAQEACWREQANGNAGSQLAAHHAHEAAVRAAIDNMLDYDIELITEVVEREAT